MNFIRRSAGTAVRRSVAGCMTPGRAARRFEFAIRPRTCEPATDGHPGDGAVVEPLGRTLLTVDVDGHQFRAVLDADTDAKRGETSSTCSRARPHALVRQRDGSARKQQPRRRMTRRTTDSIERARAILRDNDRGGYTVPTKGLYPFQWNWDSAFDGAGPAPLRRGPRLDRDRDAVRGQWPDGMVPHIVFHVDRRRLLPRPRRLGRDRHPHDLRHHPAARRRLRRPPPAASALPTGRGRRARARCCPKVDAWHRWFYANRDPDGDGLVAIIHPWEIGARQLDRLGRGLERVPTDGTSSPTSAATPARRPGAPADQGAVRPLHLAGAALPRPRLGQPGCTRPRRSGSSTPASTPSCCARLRRPRRSRRALGDGDRRERTASGRIAGSRRWSAWSDAHGQSSASTAPPASSIDSASIGGLRPPSPPSSPASRRSGAHHRAAGRRRAYIVPRTIPTDPRFDSKRYWRGPAWLVVNYMIADGLAQAGETAVAERIRESSLELIAESGFAEYYDPISGEPLGGGRFTWTAAMVLEFVEPMEAVSS